MRSVGPAGPMVSALEERYNNEKRGSSRTDGELASEDAADD